jgi:hypothetical protein
VGGCEFFLLGAFLAVDRSALRQCVHCGRLVPVDCGQCPTCREELPEVRAAAARPTAERPSEIRRGMLAMLLAGVIHYFSGGYSAMNLPYPINPVITVYLSPMLFLSGLGLVVYGFFTWKKD